MVARRHDLVTALISCAEITFREQARRFVRGLSADELQFIAEYLGSAILDPARACGCSRAELAARVADFQRARCSDRSPDEDHKMILLLEFLCRSGLRQYPAVAASGMN